MPKQRVRCRRGLAREGAVDDFLDGDDAVSCDLFFGGFGDDTHDGLGVARAGVNPGARLGPVNADAVLGVDLFGGEFFLQGGDGAVGFFAGTVEFGFHDLVTGDFFDQGGDRFSRGGHQLENIGHAHQGIAAGDDAGVDDPAVPFAADDGVVAEHGVDDVGFADGGSDDAGAGGGGDVIEHAAAGEIRHGDAGLFGEEKFGAEREGIFFADVVAMLVDDGEAIGVGVLGEAYRGALAADFIGEAC